MSFSVLCDSIGTTLAWCNLPFIRPDELIRAEIMIRIYFKIVFVDSQRKIPVDSPFFA